MRFTGSVGHCNKIRAGIVGKCLCDLLTVKELRDTRLCVSVVNPSHIKFPSQVINKKNSIAAKARKKELFSRANQVITAYFASDG